METTNKKIAVAAKRNDDVTIGHIIKGSSGRYAKTIFYFLRADKLNICTVISDWNTSESLSWKRNENSLHFAIFSSGESYMYFKAYITKKFELWRVFVAKDLRNLIYLQKVRIIELQIIARCDSMSLIRNFQGIRQI